MLSCEAIEKLTKEINAFKQRKTELFTQEITSSPAYARMFPLVLSLMNDNEKKLIACVDLFNNLIIEIFSYPYEKNSDKCANDFIAEIEDLLSEMESLINEIDWTK